MENKYKILKNCMIYDGTGSKPYQSEILIQGERIKRIAPKIEIANAKKINMEGLITAPGFIDIHRHADLVPYILPNFTSELEQGITTVINGNCGFSPFPFRKSSYKEVTEFAQPLLGEFPIGAEWEDFLQYKNAMEHEKKSVNMGTLSGNGTLRVDQNGLAAEWQKENSFEAILDKLNEIQSQGVFGLSMGLMYYPECCYTRQELLRIAECVGKHNHIITVHLRGEGAKACESVKEIIGIAKASAVHFHISHLKAAGKAKWGRTAEMLLELLYKARAEGVFITWDAYPYDAGSTTLNTLLPPWVLQGGAEKLISRLEDKSIRNKVIKELRATHNEWDNLVLATGWERVIVLNSVQKEYTGNSIAQLAKHKGIEPEEMCLQILAEDRGSTNIAFFHMSQSDVDKILLLDETCVISDSLYSKNGYEHPRGSGIFSKFIKQYAVTEKRLTLEQAIAKCTGLPAKYMGIQHRGVIKEGNYADIIAFQKERLTDRSTYQEPNAKAEGIRYVFVNGAEAFCAGKVMSADAGKLLVKEEIGFNRRR